MKEEEIKKIINQLENVENLNEEAYVNFFYEHEDEYVSISANKKGIIKLTSELLKTLILFDFHLSKENHFSMIPIKKQDWIDKNSHVIFNYFNPKKEKREDILKHLENQEDKKESKIRKLFFDFLIKGALIFFLLSLIFGAIQILGFIINLFL